MGATLADSRADGYPQRMDTRLLRSVAAFSFLLLGGFGECRTQEAMSLVASGYTLISPASNLIAPGAIVMLKKDEQGRAQLRLICGPRASLGEHFSPRVSATMSGTYKMSRSQRVELEADAVEKFKARTKVEDVDTVSVSFTNSRVIEASEDDIVTGIEYRSEACRRAIEARIDAGFRPTFISSAFSADVEYVVSFKREREMSKRVREERMGRIAANLGGGHTEITDHSLRAVNLVLAVRNDDFAMSIRPTGAGSQLPNDPSRGLGLPFAEAEPGSDAPPVPPPNYSWVSPVRGP